MTELQHDSRLMHIIEEALREDIGMGDVTSEATIPPELNGTAELRCKERGVIAGLEAATLVFLAVDQEITFRGFLSDGASVERGTIAGSIIGNVASLLKAERTALNILQRMSGIATLTRAYVDAVAGSNAKIIDTRKTAPGLRLLDKLAVTMGGGWNHRFGLDDMVLIKNNHIDAAGGIDRAIAKALAHIAEKGYPLQIEVETRNLEEVRLALAHKGIFRIMFDNFTPGDLAEAVRLVNGSVETEASGGITLASVRRVAETGVDYVSVGALTHSPAALDISMTLLA